MRHRHNNRSLGISRYILPKLGRNRQTTIRINRMLVLAYKAYYPHFIPFNPNLSHKTSIYSTKKCDCQGEKGVFMKINKIFYEDLKQRKNKGRKYFKASP